MLFSLIQRKRHAKGYGIHSPFAFHFITRVVYSPHIYYAFSDIEILLSKLKSEVENPKLHHLSYRLVQYFCPRSVLEICPPSGVNSLYICHSQQKMRCHNWVQSGDYNTTVQPFLENHFSQFRTIKKADDACNYDAIFVYPHKNEIEPDRLLSCSEKDAFWIIAGINKGAGKHLWRKLVKDSRIQVTMDWKDIGIVVLKKDFLKSHYLI